MMYEKFSQMFAQDPSSSSGNGEAKGPGVGAEFDELIHHFGGRSFQNGLYRIAKAADLDEWKQKVLVGFPEFEPRITCFGYDWVGTVFAADSGRLVEGRPGVVMFEPGTGQALNVPANVQSFHETGLSEFGEAALGIEFHSKWLASGGAAPRYDQCVGYKRPLFLGGTDDIENLEISDLSVYWHLMGQLIRKARNLPPGTRVKVTN
jgi:Domain of unknown function (DUF1851)